jgi:hypothetical protein
MVDKYEYIPETPEFARFWAVYPKKQNKADAKKAWRQTEMIRPSIEVVLKAVINEKSSNKWRKDGGDYIPLPATWLRAEGWENSADIDLGDVVNGKMWHETEQGTIKKGQEFGLKYPDEKWDSMSKEMEKKTGRTVHPWRYFEREVFNLAGHNVSQIKAA